MIVLVCGPPGAGKTTTATLLRDRLAESGRSVRLLDSDQFGRNTYDRLYDRIDGSENCDWIVAGTFYKGKWQERFERLDGVVVVHLTAELDTCLERNRGREDPIDETGVHVIRREFDDPDADLTVDTTDRSPGEVVDRVLAALAPTLDGTSG